MSMLPFDNANRGGGNVVPLTVAKPVCPVSAQVTVGPKCCTGIIGGGGGGCICTIGSGGWLPDAFEPTPNCGVVGIATTFCIPTIE